MNIQFSIPTLGYLVAEFKLREGDIRIGHSSYYGDKFQELLNGLFLIYNNNQNAERNFSPYVFEVIWNDDRINYLWLISTPVLGADIQIQIFEVSPVDSTRKVQILNNRIEFNQLFDSVYSSLKNMLLEFGFIGFKKNWEVGNFPVYEYLKLKSDKYGWAIHKVKVADDDEWKGKVSIEDEWKILSNDF